jgi:predicted transcriptional regulator
MYKEVELEIDNETLTKLDKLAAQQAKTRDELVNESLKAELDALEPVNA